MRMSVPSTGIDAPGTVARRNEWPITLCNVFEIKRNLMKYLTHITGTQVAPRDIMNFNPQDLERFLRLLNRNRAYASGQGVGDGT